ncbi:MAG: asparagine synthase-related protein [Parabacteroides distasonis]
METYDVTTVRASTPMYLLARVIKSMGIKMVLSGERCRRDLRRLPLFPQSTRCPCLSRRDRTQTV